MKISILTICPEYFAGFREVPMIKRSLQKERLAFEVIDIRTFAPGSFRRVDDSPYGGGNGLVLRCQPVVDAIRSIRTEQSHVIALSPIGRPYVQEKARELARKEHLILLCGHFEGFDARIYEYVDEIISVGDYVLSGGEIPAMAVTDSVVRLLPGNLREGSAEDESFENGLLEYPQYTKPAEFEGKKVPEVLLSGDHEAVQRWRREKAVEITKKYRPDLLDRRVIDG